MMLNVVAAVLCAELNCAVRLCATMLLVPCVCDTCSHQQMLDHFHVLGVLHLFVFPP